MKYLVVFLVLIGFAGLFLNGNYAYGLWVPQSPQELMEQSETIFVGTVQSVNVLEFERSNTYNVEENGVPKTIIENYTQNLDEYTVNIEEFLKNPQESNSITMLEATVGGVPGRSVSIGGFELGDRVLFYVPKIDGTNQYSPESFKIPRHCDAKTVLEQPRIDGANDFRMMQDGVAMQDNFTANKKIQFVFDKDMRTLYGAGFNVDVAISKVLGKNEHQPMLKESIHVESQPCEWITTAQWDFIPTVGEYDMWMNYREDNSSGYTTGGSRFSVVDNMEFSRPKNLDDNGDSQSETRKDRSGIMQWVAVTTKSQPIKKQAAFGIPFEHLLCKSEGQTIVTKISDGSPACVTPSTKQKLIERGWAKEDVIPIFEYVIKKDNVTYGSSYQIVGGVVDEIHYNKDSNSLIVSLSESEKGYLQILIQIGVLQPPRESSFTYFVLLDGEEVLFEKLSPIILKIPFEKGNKLIEIIGAFPV